MQKTAPETRPRPRRGVGEDLSPLQTAMMAAEVKVADWLAQNELPLALKEPAAVEEVVEDGESVKSDAPLQQKSLKGTEWGVGGDVFVWVGDNIAYLEKVCFSLGW